MKTLSSIVAVTALSLGSAGAAIAYTSISDSPASSTRITPPTLDTDTVAKEPAAQIRTRFRPCEPGAKLEEGRCVRHVVRTVVVPAPPPPVAANAATTRTEPEGHRGSGPRDSTEDDDRAREREPEDEEHGEDQDEHESDHGEENEDGEHGEDGGAGEDD